jgi:pilus assembly protein CpaF
VSEELSGLFQIGLGIGEQAAPPPVSQEVLREVEEEIVTGLKDQFKGEDFMDKSPENRRRFEEAAYRIISRIIARRNLVLPRDVETRCVRTVVNRVIGLGVFQDYMPPYCNDLEELVLNPDGRLWLSIRGKPGWMEDSSFRCTPEEARNAALRILEMTGRAVSGMHPIEDGRIPRGKGGIAMGARFNVALPPVAVGEYPAINLRFWTEDLPTLEDLLRWQTLSPEIALFLQEAVQQHTNIVVAGGTKTGKTTLLNILCSFIPEGERIVTVEDTHELMIAPRYNWVAMEAKPPNIEGKGEVSLGMLVRNALRQSPDWLIPGEIRDGEAAYQALRALSTGHYGMTTVHAESAYDTPRMIVNLAQGAGYYSGNKEAAKERFAMAIRLIVHLGFLPGTSRRVITRVCEVEPHLRKGDVYLRDLFRYDRKDLWEKVEEPRFIGRLSWEFGPGGQED